MIYLRVQLDGAAVKGKLVKGPYKPIHRNCAIYFLSICISTGQWSDSPRLWTFFLDSKPRLSGQLFGKVGGVHLTWNPPKRAGESIKHQSLPNFYSHIIQYIIYMYIFCNILCQKDAIPDHTIIKNEREASLHKAVEEDMIFSRNFREAWINLCGISVGANGSGMFLGLGSHSPWFLIFLPCMMGNEALINQTIKWQRNSQVLWLISALGWVIERLFLVTWFQFFPVLRVQVSGTSTAQAQSRP